MARIIDAHAHIFPDNIAAKAVAATGGYYGIPMDGDGTVAGLLNSGAEIGVSRYIVHSTATRPEQVVSINDYIAAEVKKHREFIGFGTLHAGFGGIAGETERIISLGLRGIKLHTDFQGFAIDDEAAMLIYAAAEGRLPVLFHMGDAKSDLSHPARLARVLARFPRLTAIGAHLGGYSAWGESEKHLVGKNLYFDSSSSLDFLPPARAAAIIRAHGAEKILFGSDYPMWSHSSELARFMRLPLTEAERELILYNNAARLFDIE